MSEADKRHKKEEVRSNDERVSSMEERVWAVKRTMTEMRTCRKLNERGRRRR